MVARQITFTASETVQDLIKEANIGDKKQSKWINDKITKAVMDSKEKKEIGKEFSKGKIIGVQI